jgi:O-glycosyl hydrolase
MATALQNPNGSISVVLLNMETEAKTFQIEIEGAKVAYTIAPQAIQTVVIPNSEK